MIKYKTGIPGLDTLFNGGLQISIPLERRKIDVDSNQIKNQELERGLVIVIRGSKGSHKTNLAANLMNGLSRTLNNENKSRSLSAIFYSINKSQTALNDLFLDMVIAELMQHIIRDYRKWELENIENDKEYPHFEELRHLIHFIFDTDQANTAYPINLKGDNRDKEAVNGFIEMICRGMIIYNPRTNSLHFKNTRTNDDDENFVARRRYHSVHEYISNIKYEAGDDENIDIKAIDKGNYSLAKSFIDSLLNVAFYSYEDLKKKISIPMNAISHYRAIQSDINDRYINLTVSVDDSERKDSENYKSSNSETRPDILVIDGFSQLRDKDLIDLPFASLCNTMSRIAKVSILVFDDRNVQGVDGDIIIDMRANTDSEEEYMYHELRVTKSVFQTSVLGWHQYKMRPDGIHVFPSTHMLLSKRFYLSNRSHNIGQNLYDTNYDQFIDTIKFESSHNVDIMKRPFKYYQRNAGEWRQKLQSQYFEDYAKELSRWNSNIEKAIDLSASDAYDKVLEKILFHSSESENPVIDDKSLPNHCRTHFPSTVIIGNPNSFKRIFSLATSYHLAKNKKHTLFILFNQNEMDIRRKMVCPAYKKKECQKLEKCMSCTKYLHTFNIRMGCITAEEFFSILQDQIEFYCNLDEEEGVEKDIMHIVIDDIHKLDHSFPFLNSTKLFLSALVAICNNHRVKLTILCDKRYSKVHELCSLADNVLDITREPEMLDKVEMGIERRSEDAIPSHILQLEISDIYNLFDCNGEKFTMETARHTSESQCSDSNEDSDINTPEESPELQTDHRIKGRTIGSMKEYWRKTINTVEKYK